MVSSCPISSGGKSYSKQPTFIGAWSQNLPIIWDQTLILGVGKIEFIFCKLFFTVSLLKEEETNYLKIAQTKSI